MSRQDKATTDRNARLLRELVKQPDNKACADCRKNDARWASWNLGVFLCIRCSGIHRSMGTHISKVKSIDLDIWTPEQMESVQKWGNRRANLYWERHLKQGHVPPDHKIESFIRSKYESKRWALDGPPPRDPSVLENGTEVSGPPPVDLTSKPQPSATVSALPPAAGSRAHPLLSRTAAHKVQPSQATAPPPAPIIDLFGDDQASAPAAVPTAAPTQPVMAASEQATTAAAPPGPTSAPAPVASNIFDLDFRAPTPQVTKPTTAKADIMSLFATSPGPASAQPVGGSFFSAAVPTSSATLPSANTYASWSGGVTSSAPPVPQAPTQAPVPTWGGFQDQAAWGTPASQQPPAGQSQPPYSQISPSVAQNQSSSTLWGSNDPWATANAAPVFAQSPPVVTKKDDRDPFANIWQ